VRQIVECLLAAVMDRADGAGVCVRVRVGIRRSGWSAECERLNRARAVLAFAVGSSGDGADAAGDPAPAGRGQGFTRDELDGGELESVPSPGALARGGALGLAISHELASLLGGELREGEGSAAFTLYLPACGVEHRSVPAIAGAASSAGGSRGQAAPAGSEHRPAAVAAAPFPELAELWGVELLLIDPDVRQAFTLTGELERQGASVTHAEDLKEATQRLAARRAPCVVLVDAGVLAASPEPAVQGLLRLAEQTPVIVLRATGDHAASSPHVHRLSRSADARELAALLQRVAVSGRALQTRAR
jgi:CheY-like chemotaxis protein